MNSREPRFLASPDRLESLRATMALAVEHADALYDERKDGRTAELLSKIRIASEEVETYATR